MQRRATLIVMMDQWLGGRAVDEKQGWSWTRFESGISKPDPKLVLWILGSRYLLRAIPNFNLDFYAQIPRVDPNLVFWGVFFY